MSAQTTIDNSEVKQQLAIVENGVNYSARRFNDLKVMNDRLTRDLKARLDELDNQKRAFERLDAMKKVLEIIRSLLVLCCCGFHFTSLN
jgi:hypothetical protein